MNYVKYFRVTDSDDNVRFESLSEDECSQFMQEVFKSSGDILNIEEVEIE